MERRPAQQQRGEQHEAASAVEPQRHAERGQQHRVRARRAQALVPGGKLRPERHGKNARQQDGAHAPKGTRYP